MSVYYEVPTLRVDGRLEAVSGYGGQRRLAGRNVIYTYNLEEVRLVQAKYQYPSARSVGEGRQSGGERHRKTPGGLLDLNLCEVTSFTTKISNQC
ncbi:hypothetical protein Pve01_35350 [Planomonospora venezuelensis]|nr:hypothetical protein Pve01_35350 [Planomonospora venezuelensis]